MLSILLAVHILSAIVFVGNIITAAFWKVRADRTGSLEVIAANSRALIRADFAFTGPGVIILLVTGVWMVGITSWDRFQEMWLAISLGLLLLTLAIWLTLLVPLELVMARRAREGLQNGALDPAYTRASRLWAISGGIATLLPVVILFLMVLKPGT